MWDFYVYAHLQKDTGIPFYIGKGKMRRGRSYERANAVRGRSQFWQSVADKHGWSVWVIASCADDTEAQRLEIRLVRELGRRNRGLGPLVNLTDGGDGHAGLVASEDLRIKRSRNGSLPRTQKWIDAIRRARKNGGNGGVVRKGDKLPDWWKERISSSASGAANSQYGKKGSLSARSRRVLASDGTIYASVSLASAAAQIPMKTLYNKLSGHRPNDTGMRFI